VAAGLTTRNRLRGPGFRRLFPDTYVRRGDPLTPTLRAMAAYRYAEPHGVLAGYSAAELLGASCGPQHAPAEITVPGPGRRAHPGLLVHRVTLAPGEIRRCGGVRVTTAVRTAWDLARRGDLVDAVVAVDTLARVGRFNPDLLLNFLTHYPRARGASAVPGVLALADRRSGSPMETGCGCCWSASGYPRTPARSGCCATSGAEPGWSTRAGASTVTPRRRSTPSPDGSSPRCAERWPGRPDPDAPLTSAGEAGEAGHRESKGRVHRDRGEQHAQVGVGQVE
jgi:hypothetical protein